MTQFLHYCVVSGFTEVVTIIKLFMLILDSFVLYGWSFSQVQIFAKQAEIQVSEIFAVLIFVVCESWTHGL